MIDSLTVAALSTLFQDFADSDKLVIRRETLLPSLGALPTIEITGAHAGFDWDSGKVFLSTACPVQAAGEAFLAERKAAKELQSMLEKIGSINRGELSPAQKVEAIRAVFLTKRTPS